MVSSLLDQRRLILLALQEWQEGLSQSKIAHIVSDELFLNHVQINSLGLRKVEHPLNARVQDYTVEIGVRFGDTTLNKYQASGCSFRRPTL